MKNVMRTIVRVVSDDKRNWTDTLRPKGMESDYNDWQCIIRNGQVVSGSEMASKVFISIRDVELGKPYMLPKYAGRNSVRSDDGIEGKGIGKKRMSSCNLQRTDTNWKKVEKYVNRLQPRITKAVKPNCCPIQKGL